MWHSDDSTLVASQVVLATGGTQNSIKLPLIAALADRFQLPLRNGLPLLDQDLQWCEGISVVGVCVYMCVREGVCVCVHVCVHVCPDSFLQEKVQTEICVCMYIHNTS